MIIHINENPFVSLPSRKACCHSQACHSQDSHLKQNSHCSMLANSEYMYHSPVLTVMLGAGEARSSAAGLLTMLYLQPSSSLPQPSARTRLSSQSIQLASKCTLGLLLKNLHCSRRQGDWSNREWDCRCGNSKHHKAPVQQQTSSQQAAAEIFCHNSSAALSAQPCAKHAVNHRLVHGIFGVVMMTKLESSSIGAVICLDSSWGVTSAV